MKKIFILSKMSLEEDEVFENECEVDRIIGIYKSYIERDMEKC